MFIITDKNNVVIHFSETKDFQENGNLLIKDGTLAIANNLLNGVYEVEEIPENVQEHKYCFTEEKGFYENENYIAPEPDETTRIRELEQQITDLQLALAELVEGGVL